VALIPLQNVAMDLSVSTFVFGSVLSIVGLSVSIAALDEAKRQWLFSLWARWAGRAFIGIMIVNSVLGIFLFWWLKGVPGRGEVLMLVVHVVNLLSAAFIIFMSALESALDARNAKRTKLEETVKKLEEQITALTSFKAMPMPLDSGKRL
jgi:cell division protein FtsB